MVSMKLTELKEEILQLYEDYDIIDKSLMKQLEEIFPLPIPKGLNKYDAYLLLLNNDFDVSIDEIIERIKWKKEVDKEITMMLF